MDEPAAASTSPSSGAFCAVHPERRALTLCHRCGSYACDTCAQVGKDQRDYCAACLPRLEPVLATRASRFIAALVDNLAVFAPYTMGGLLQGMSGSGSTATVLGAVGTLGVIGYQIHVFLQSGQSLGKRLVGIKVVRTDGGPMDLGRLLFLRNLVPALINLATCYLFGLVDALLIFSEPRRCLHDHIADTRVVDVGTAER